MKASDGGGNLYSAAQSIVDESVRRACVGIGLILVNDWRHKWDGVGTGFLATYGGQVYLITAKHVIDLAFGHKQVAMKVANQLVFLHGIFFASDSESDIAVTLLPTHWLESYHIKFLYMPRLELLSSVYESTGQYVLVGFPASKNKLDVRWQEMDTMVVSISANLNQGLIGSLSKIPDPLYVNYDHKAYGRNMPALHGMSGGPLFEVMSRNVGKREDWAVTKPSWCSL